MTCAAGGFKIVAPFVCMPSVRAITLVCAATLISHVRCTPLIKFTEPGFARDARLYIKLILKRIKAAHTRLPFVFHVGLERIGLCGKCGAGDDRLRSFKSSRFAQSGGTALASQIAVLDCGKKAYTHIFARAARFIRIRLFYQMYSKTATIS